MKTQPAVIVLAAGKGSRFEGNDHKLSQRLGTATVLGTTLRHAIASGREVVVVTTTTSRRLAIACRRVVPSTVAAPRRWDSLWSFPSKREPLPAASTITADCVFIEASCCFASTAQRGSRHGRNTAR